SRLERAKEGARLVVDSMSGDDLAMVIAFDDSARVVSNYTGNRDELRARIAAIAPTRASTSLREALQVAAGLANPSRFVEGVPATSIVAPKLL
ncbi:VWA domain-containing protein, partial [Escherichia coli]|nr:VWA domain-containing protein [Escherichia coli]